MGEEPPVEGNGSTRLSRFMNKEPRRYNLSFHLNRVLQRFLFLWTFLLYEALQNKKEHKNKSGKNILEIEEILNEDDSIVLEQKESSEILEILR